MFSHLTPTLAKKVVPRLVSTYASSHRAEVANNSVALYSGIFTAGVVTSAAAMNVHDTSPDILASFSLF